MTSLRGALGLGAVVALAGFLFSMAPTARVLEEDLGLTWLFHMRGPRAVPAEVAVVAIDGSASRALGQGRPPEWTRTLHARLVDALSAAGARAVVFDLSFATHSPDPAVDQGFAQAMSNAGNVVLLDFIERSVSVDQQMVVERRLPPHPLLAAAAAAHGPFVLPKGGYVHAYWLFKPEAGGTATLPMLAFRVHQAMNAGTQVVEPREDQLYLDFYGPPRTVPTFGFDQVLGAADRGAVGAAWLRETFGGRGVFVGFSSADPGEQDRLRDDYRTVFSRADGLNLSGVEIAATAFANLRENRAPRQLAPTLQGTVLFVWAVLLGGLGAMLRGARALAAMLIACCGYALLALQRFSVTAEWLPLVAPLLVQAPLALLLGLLSHYVEERRRRSRLGSLVEDLLPPVVARPLLSQTRGNLPADQPLFCVFLMTDIAGFTSVAESISPEQTTRLLNDYFSMIFPVVERKGGSVSEITGDGLLAFWTGAVSEQTARRGACLAALEIDALVNRGNSAGASLATRIGVHAGEVTLARLGAAGHHEYRVVGDAANTASRIEGLSKHLGTRLLVSAEVLDGLAEMLVRPLGAFVLAGKSAPLRVHELVGLASATSPEQHRLCADFASALQSYLSRDWDDAAARWSAILRQWPDDGPSRFYLQRAESNASAPPPDDWDGSLSMTSK